jgi:hypothetical protein
MDGDGVFVIDGNTEHPAILLEHLKEGLDSITVKWTTSNTVARVPTSSVLLQQLGGTRSRSRAATTIADAKSNSNSRSKDLTMVQPFHLDNKTFIRILDHLSERELFLPARLVCTKWFDSATIVHSNWIISHLSSDSNHLLTTLEANRKYLTKHFPYGYFLADGGFKTVYRVSNNILGVCEAVSVM